MFAGISLRNVVKASRILRISLSRSKAMAPSSNYPEKNEADSVGLALLSSSLAS